jgi:hypothetical protein
MRPSALVGCWVEAEDADDVGGGAVVLLQAASDASSAVQAKVRILFIAIS